MLFGTRPRHRRSRCISNPFFSFAKDSKQSKFLFFFSLSINNTFNQSQKKNRKTMSRRLTETIDKRWSNQFDYPNPPYLDIVHRQSWRGTSENVKNQELLQMNKIEGSNQHRYYAIQYAKELDRLNTRQFLFQSGNRAHTTPSGLLSSTHSIPVMYNSVFDEPIQPMSDMKRAYIMKQRCQLQKISPEIQLEDSTSSSWFS